MLFKNNENLAKVQWAIDQHTNTNHKYDSQPYSYHLNMVASIAYEFRHLVSEEYFEEVYVACYFHDTIEDTRVTYNDVLAVAGGFIADITYALTNEKGRNRKQRANSKYYAGIRATPYATFIKLCDRIANMKHSKKTSSGMFEKYKQELVEFKKELDYSPKYKEMFEYMETL